MFTTSHIRSCHGQTGAWLKGNCKSYKNRLNEFHKFETANKELYKEIDMEYFIVQFRVLKMIMRAITKKRQRNAVKYFERYLIEDGEEPKDDHLFNDGMAAEQMVDSFDAVNDKIDKRLLYELTGRKLDPEDYFDDSGEDQD